MPPALPRSGDVLYLTRAASVQFIRPTTVRVIRLHDWPTYDGWCWIDCYELNAAGDAVERRSLFVQIDGVQRVTLAADGRRRSQDRTAPPRQPAGRGIGTARTD